MIIVYLMLSNYLENIASHGIASQSSVYYWEDMYKYMTADLAITGGPTHHVLPHFIDLYSMLRGGC